MEVEENKIIDGEEKLGSIVTSVRISRHFFDLCKEYDISFTEAIRVGISVILAEKGIKPYDNDLNLYRKMLRYQKLVEEKTIELEVLKGKAIALEKLNKYSDIEKDFKEAGLS